jgi:hypothetical protein
MLTAIVRASAEPDARAPDDVGIRRSRRPLLDIYDLLGLEIPSNAASRDVKPPRPVSSRRSADSAAL